MPLTIRLLLILTLSIFSSFAFSWPTDELKNYSLIPESSSFSEGLSQQTVTSAVEDYLGYLWIGTSDGLNRYDGNKFKHYFSGSSGLNSSFIQSLHIHNNLLWVGTNKGLYVYDKALDKFKLILLADTAVWSIQSINKKLVVGTYNSVQIIDTLQNKIIKKYTNKLFQGVKSINIINFNFYIRNYDGTLIKFDTRSKIGVEISAKTIQAYTVANTLEFAKSDGIYNLKNIDSPFIKKHMTAVTLFEKKIYYLNKNKVINTEHHASKSNLTNLKFKGKNLFITSNYILTTNENNTGLKAYIKKRNTVKTTNGIDYQIWDVEVNNDKIIVSGEPSKIKVLDRNYRTEMELETDIVGHKVVSILRENLFIGSSSGLIKINLNTRGKETIYEGEVNAITKSVNQNIIYFANNEQHQILKYDSKDESITLIGNHIDNKPIFQIQEIQENRLLVAGQAGLFEIGFNYTKSIYNTGIVYGVSSSKNISYFSTSSGIYSFTNKDKKLTKIVSTKKPIYSIIHKNGVIIGSGIKEIIVYNKGTSIVLSTEFGSQIEYNTQSAAVLGDEFVLGGALGLSVVNLKKIEDLTKTLNTETVLDDLLIFNIPVKIGGGELKLEINSSKEIKLKHSDYPFSITFSSPKIGIKNTEFYYRLIGLSTDWINDKYNNSATYTNLSPGNYNFEVYAKNPITGLPGPIKRVDVMITPPWWRSSTAMALYLLCAILIALTIVKALIKRRKTQRQIVLSEERLKLSLWGSGDEMWDWDIETGKIFRSNIWGSLDFPRDGRRSGKPSEESNIHPMDQKRVQDSLNQHLRGETEHFEAAYRVKGKNDHWVWILDRAKVVEYDGNDRALRMTGTIKNINQFKQAEEQLRLFERAIENISEGVFILDNHYRFVEVNKACCKIALESRKYFIGQLLSFDRYPASFSEKIRLILKQQGQWLGEVEASRGDGTSFSMELTIDAIYDVAGELSHFVGVFSDITIRKQQEEELRKLTNTDLLTGLPNRSNLQVTLSNLVRKESHHTLMVLDIDNFKRINDSLGHQSGDELLTLIADRITNNLPKQANLYRLGGDEFAVLIDKTPDLGSSAAIASKIIDRLTLPFNIENENLVIGVSIGIVFYPEDETDEKALLRKADIAMYHAKSAGGKQYQFYSESLNRNAMRQLEIESYIREALRDDLFEVHYQPKIDIKINKIAGMEALVRLNHPQKGLIPPGEFIPFAEENGLIVEIGELVLRKACFAAQKWREENLFNGRIAVNLSSHQFAQPDLLQRIATILKLTKLPARHLELEITEGTVITNPEKAIQVMNELSLMGVSLALDDFGTGYSSLSYLKRFPIHTLKIDKSFVDDIDKSERDLKMVDSIITIAHNMGLSVVGEGVEDTAQLNILKGLGCEEIQGFIFSKAVPENQFSSLLKGELAQNSHYKTNF